MFKHNKRYRSHHMGHHMYNHSLPANKNSSLNRHSECFFTRILIVVLHCFGQSKYSLFLYLKNAKKIFFPTDFFYSLLCPRHKMVGVYNVTLFRHSVLLRPSVIPSTFTFRSLSQQLLQTFDIGIWFRSVMFESYASWT